MPRFVILEHDFPDTHWDLMLETGSVLRTWRLERVPEAGQALKAEASFDHRLIYLNYEGPVSGGRGHVRRWDGGSFQFEVDADDRIVVHLSGERVKGKAEIAKATNGDWVLYLNWPPCQD